METKQIIRGANEDKDTEAIVFLLFLFFFFKKNIMNFILS